MDKAGEAMLEGLILFAAIIAVVIAGIAWLIRRSMRNRRAQIQHRIRQEQRD